MSPLPLQWTVLVHSLALVHRHPKHFSLSLSRPLLPEHAARHLEYPECSVELKQCLFSLFWDTVVGPHRRALSHWCLVFSQRPNRTSPATWDLSVPCLSSIQEGLWLKQTLLVARSKASGCKHRDLSQAPDSEQLPGRSLGAVGDKLKRGFSCLEGERPRGCAAEQQGRRLNV